MEINRLKRLGSSLGAAAMLYAFGSPARALEFGGMGDVYYRESTNKENPSRSGFSKGTNLDLYASHQIGERSDVLVELVLHPQGDHESIHVERIQAGYIHADWLKIRAGRFHNLLGYWNLAYHHGAFLQTSISRPAFLEYEHFEGLLPMHAVGVWIEGNLRARTVPWITHYGVMVSNGSKIETVGVHASLAEMQNILDDATPPSGILNPQNSGAENPSKAVGFNIDFRPPGGNFRLGFSGYKHRLRGSYLSGAHAHSGASTGTPAAVDVDQLILGPYLAFEGSRFQLLAELHQVRNTDNLAVSSPSTSGHVHGSADLESTLFYVQAAYYVVADRFQPYVRYEVTDIPGHDPYFAALGGANTVRWVEGVRFNINEHNCLKAEVRQNRVYETDHSNSFRQFVMQWAFGF